VCSVFARFFSYYFCLFVKNLNNHWKNIFHIQVGKNSYLGINCFLLVEGNLLYFPSSLHFIARFVLFDSVLKCLLREEFEEEDQDLDFFAINFDYVDHTDFCESFCEDVGKNLNCLGKPEGDSYVYNVTFNPPGKKSLRFQFIWY
jgi:hypothetical protein